MNNIPTHLDEEDLRNNLILTGKYKTKRVTLSRPTVLDERDEKVLRDIVVASYAREGVDPLKRTSRQKRVRNMVKKIQEGDPEIQDELLHVQHSITKPWASEANAAILAAIRFIGKAALVADPKNPMAITAMANALKTINEAELTRKVIDAKLAEHYQPYGQGDREDPLPIQRGRETIGRRPIGGPRLGPVGDNDVS